VRTAAGIDVGRTLRRERTRRRITVRQAVEDTKIMGRYLEALEANREADAYPAPVYARAFLREYARYLDLDPEPLLALFRCGDDVESDIETLLPPAPPRTRPAVPAWAVLAAALAVLVAGLAVAGRRLPDGGSARVAIRHPATPGPTSTPAGVARVLAERSVAPAAELIVAVAVAGEACWLRVTLDGAEALAQTLLPGERRAFRGNREIDLLVGNAGAIQVVVNGRAIPALGGSGAVRSLRLTLDGGTVRVDGVPLPSA
jgi:cytoskeleton protein RodZ